MIVVKIELHSARTGEVFEIGRMLIHNNLMGTRTRRDYGVRLLRRGSTNRVQRIGEVQGHPSLSASIWTLVRKAIQAVSL